MNFQHFALFIQISLLCFVSSVSSSDLNCLNSNQNARYKRGDTAVFCMHFIPNNDQTKAMRMSFQIIVDKYTAVQARGAYSSFQSYTDLSSVSLIAQADSNFTNSDNVTYIRAPTDVTSPKIIIPIFSIIINIDNGQVTSTTWDNGCWDCTSYCYLDKINVNNTQSNCRIEACNTSSASNSSTAACDPKIYISWVGTDSSGSHMNSAGLRMSNFRQYSVGQMYSSALSTYDSVLKTAQDQFNSQIESNLNNLLGTTTTTISTISFSSSAFSQNGVIPYKYTANGGNTNPGCSWTAISSAQSYAFVMNHTNSSMSTNNLLLKNIPAGVTSITDGSLAGGVAIVNSYNVQGYSGPEVCDTLQTYNCYVYALSVASINATTSLDFYSNIEQYKVGVGSFSGVYMNTTTRLVI